ncbi:hypothetical protein pb186bvf_018109 [Paramecium bursaria]
MDTKPQARGTRHLKTSQQSKKKKNNDNPLQKNSAIQSILVQIYPRRVIKRQKMFSNLGNKPSFTIRNNCVYVFDNIYENRHPMKLDGISIIAIYFEILIC